MKNGKNTKRRSRTDWKRIDAMRDEDIDYSDIPKQGSGLFCERDHLAGAEEADHVAHRSRRADVLSEAWPGISEHHQCRAAQAHGGKERTLGVRLCAQTPGCARRTAEGGCPHI